jgi:hypothetical protein
MKVVSSGQRLAVLALISVVFHASPSRAEHANAESHVFGTRPAAEGGDPGLCSKWAGRWEMRCVDQDGTETNESSEIKMNGCESMSSTESGTVVFGKDVEKTEDGYTLKVRAEWLTKGRSMKVTAKLNGELGDSKGIATMIAVMGDDGKISLSATSRNTYTSAGKTETLNLFKHCTTVGKTPAPK